MSRCQPYLDLINAAWVGSPDRLERVDVNANVPLNLDNSGSLLVFSPSFERWEVEVHATPGTGSRTDLLSGYMMPITFITTLAPDRWRLSVTGIGRYMAIEDPQRGDWQLGGAFLFQRVKSTTLTWKFGAYANADAFGLFALPLLGIDWRIDAEHNLFGVLPGILTYEHKVSRHFHWGIAYRAITTSFGTRDGDFRRVDENPIGLFVDVYPAKRIALRLEGGHTVISQYQGGRLDPLYPLYGEGKYVDHQIGDGFYFKLMLAFRVRLDEGTSTPGGKAGR